MSPIEIIAILAMTAYAIYKQTVVSELLGPGRFKLAVIYAVVGAVVGGFALPQSVLGWALLVLGLVLSAAVGVLRGRRTDVWMQPDGRLVRKGNAVTIALFLGLIAVKFGLGTVAYLADVSDGAGFGEIMIMIAIMIALQAEIVHRRGQTLLDAAPAHRKIPDTSPAG